MYVEYIQEYKMEVSGRAQGCVDINLDVPLLDSAFIPLLPNSCLSVPSWTESQLNLLPTSLTSVVVFIRSRVLSIVLISSCLGGIT